MNKLFIGELLLEHKLITIKQLEEVIEIKRRDKRTFEEIFVEEGYVSEARLLEVVAKELNFLFTDNPIKLHQPESLSIISESFARKYHVVPLYIDRTRFYFATSNPLQFSAFEDMTMMSGYDAVPIVSPTENIESTLNRIYSYGAVDEDILAGVGVTSEDKELMDRVASAPVVKMVNNIIAMAFKSNASDIHLNPEEHYTRIRLRIDGELQDYLQIKRDLHEAMITRIKIIAGMNIAEKRVPQDGAFNMNNEEGVDVDIRVASIPTRYGEKLVLRLLGSERKIEYELSKLDFDEKTKVFLKKLITIPNGIILITGPTGSGKTTTLYSMLNELATPDKAVITIEDPVEKHFEGITQVHINQKAGLTFASGLRSILRLDPDVIMIGEIRDAETASIAIRAAITGHLVLSTLHTNDALSSISRLIDMGVEPFMVASSVKCVIAQRLVRKNCAHCKVKVQTTNAERILLESPDLEYFYKGQGCEHCDHTGYSGRIAVFEVVPVNEVIQNLIAESASYSEMKDLVKDQHLPLLKDDVVRILKGGDTSIDEASKVLFNNEIFND